MRTPWTKTEIQYLKDHYHNDSMEDLVKALNKSISKIRAQAGYLQLHKSQEFFQKGLGGRSTGTIGKSTRFQKGHVSWNKGLHINTGGIQTQFKQGHKPHNTKHDGCIAQRRDKRGHYHLWYRISEGKWIQYHVKIWIDHHGSVPKGHCVTFKNRDTIDCRIENLELITRLENMHRNSIMRFPEDIRKTIHALKKLKKVIHEKDKPE